MLICYWIVMGLVGYLLAENAYDMVRRSMRGRDKWRLLF